MTRDNEILEVFQAAVGRYDTMIRRICHSYSTPRALEADMFQEVMAALWLGLKSFRGRSSLSTWVYRVTLNTCISYLRRTDYRMLYGEFPSIADISDSPSNYTSDEYDCLSYLIGRLSPLDKALILLWLDELPYSEIADITGLSTNVIGTRLSRIRTKLRQLWEDEQKRCSSETKNELK